MNLFPRCSFYFRGLRNTGQDLLGKLDLLFRVQLANVMEYGIHISKHIIFNAFGFNRVPQHHPILDVINSYAIKIPGSFA